MNDAELFRLYYEARLELAKYPGVVGVGVGLKERGGALTEERAFRVYVVEKKAAPDLAPGARIPASYKGVPTDVLRMVFARQHLTSEDRARHDPIIGGVTITNGRRGPSGFGAGTLGFFATMNGVDGFDNVVLVTNNHVLAALSGAVGDAVYQPNLDATLPNNPIAVTSKMPPKDNVSFQYPPELQRTPGEPADDYYIDCASAKLNICVSPCCHSNCGVAFASVIKGLNLAGSNALQDIGRANIGDKVFKVGRITGRTQGVVEDVSFPVPSPLPDLPSIKNAIYVRFVSADAPDVTTFAEEGDSGAAVVRDDGKLIGLHFSGALDKNSNPDPTHSLQVHIHPALAALDVTAISHAHPVDNPAQKPESAAAESAARAADRGTPELPSATGALRERFLTSDQGRRLAALVDGHRHEVVHLVNHRRRVMVAWHRNKGPAFLNRAANNARDPAVVVPRALDGITRETLLRNMARALAENGGPELRATVERHLEELVTYANGFDSLHDLVDHLASGQP